ncbi:MAG: hypothetical protein OEX04_11185 [Acidimicrobiia bacterium]|nr:hypothetical protein [Acidimicrobiia bacterium]MDH4308032.1 hypothetical protein [Acidimicrobiia bacterium]MDH5294606.1 hypothetical protein [Acidimicrobiia bacterium]
MEAGLAAGSSSWVFEMGAFDQLWINGHDLAAFADQAARQKAVDDARRIFDIVTGLVPAPSFGAGLGARILANGYGEMVGLFTDAAKDRFGSVPSDVSVALDNRDFGKDMRLRSALALIEGMVNAGVVPAPDHVFTRVAYETIGGTRIPVDRVLLPLDALQEDPALWLDLKEWVRLQRVEIPEFDKALGWLAEVWQMEDLDL